MFLDIARDSLSNLIEKHLASEHESRLHLLTRGFRKVGPDSLLNIDDMRCVRAYHGQNEITLPQYEATSEFRLVDDSGTNSKGSAFSRSLTTSRRCLLA